MVAFANLQGYPAAPAGEPRADARAPGAPKLTMGSSCSASSHYQAQGLLQLQACRTGRGSSQRAPFGNPPGAVVSAGVVGPPNLPEGYRASKMDETRYLACQPDRPLLALCRCPIAGGLAELN